MFRGDLTHAFRFLLRNRQFAVSAIVTTALGVGATVAVFSAVYGVLLRPLPYPDADRLVQVWEIHPGADAPLTGALLSGPTYEQWSDGSEALDDLAAFRVGDYTFTESGSSERLRAAHISPSLFRVLRTMPALGRAFDTDDVQQGAEPVVILGDALWRHRFGGNPSVLGRQLSIEGVTYRIVGVTPPAFAFPDVKGGWSDEPRGATLYLPLFVKHPSTSDDAIDIVQAIGRLKPDTTLARVETEGTAAARSVARPWADLAFGNGAAVEVRARQLVAHMTSRVRPALAVLAVTVVFVLLISSANVANLLLSRSMARTREFAIRSAIGASPRRLIEHAAAESMLISIVGSAAGLLLGWTLVKAMPLAAPEAFPRLEAIRIDAWSFMVAGLAAIVAAIIAGIIPATRLSRIDVASVIQDGARTTGTPAKAARRALLVGEAAMAMVLLIGATLLARSLTNLVRVDTGYDANDVVTADVYLTGAPGAPADPKRMSQLGVAAAERLRAMPGVRSAGAGNMVPFGGTLSSVGFGLPGMVTSDGQPLVARAVQMIITPGYAEALGMRLKDGRFFRPDDVASTIQPMMVNETFARTYLSSDGRPAVGRRFVGMFPRMLGRDDAAFEIVAVVGDVLLGLDAQPQPHIYLLHGGAFDMGRPALVIRTSDAPGVIAGTMSTIVQQLEPTAALDRISRLSDKVSSSIGEPRFASYVVGAFSLLALALAATGLYAVLSHRVVQRRREMGVRTALGATRASLMRMVVFEGLSLTVQGLVIGMIAAALLMRLAANLLFGVSPVDAVSFVIASLLLLCVALVACLVPAWRAASVDAAKMLQGSSL